VADAMTLVTQARTAGTPDLLSVHARLQPGKVAVIEDRPGEAPQRVTFAELEDMTHRLVNVLLALGARAGSDTVVWCGPNSLGVVVAVNAARILGITAVPLNYRSSDDEAAYVTDHSDATLVLVDAEYAAMFERIRHQVPTVREVLVYGVGVEQSVPQGMVDLDVAMAEVSKVIPSTAALPVVPGATMIYTSGTTGKPKGAWRSGAGDSRQAQAMIAHIGYTPDDIYLTTGPLYHSGPGGFMAIAQLLGQTVVVQRKFDAEDWLRLVSTYGVTSTFTAPTPIRMITRLPAEVKARYDVSSMKRMIANAAPWSMALKQAYLSDFPHDSLWEVYGSTELGVNCILRPEDQLRKPGSCGRAAPMVEVALFDDGGQRVSGVGPEHTGELYVKSPSVFADYYKQHDTYLADQHHGYQTVGDIAYLDHEGYVYICDRKKDMIISGGMNVYPAEIEAALEQHPLIVEAAVFGIPSEDWGEVVHAVVVPHAPGVLTADDVMAFAREHLAGYKVPRSVSWLDDLPKTGSGKVLKRALRDPYWEGRNQMI
jgi:acyl-CoA synthetase (AMP-forming)/AMP-acid ligase II